MTDAVRVLLVDENAVSAEALARTLSLEPAVHVVGTAADRAAAVAAVERDGPGVVVTVARVLDDELVELIGELCAKDHTVRVVALTESFDEGAMTRAIGAGLVGLLVQTESSLADLVAAIHRAARGDTTLNYETLVALVHHAPDRPDLDTCGLTLREREVLEEMATGVTTETIGRHLGIARDTARNHVASVLSKLHAHSKLEAVTLAWRRGLLAPPISPGEHRWIAASTELSDSSHC